MKQDDLTQLRTDFPKWIIRKTSGGKLWARRQKHLVETEETVDLGFLPSLVAPTATKLVALLREQEDLHKKHGVRF